MKLVEPKDPILHTPAQEYNFADPLLDQYKLYDELSKFMLEHNGVGLAAPQVGLPYRIIVVLGTPCIVMFNPKIISTSGNLVASDERCLSFPGIELNIKRPTKVKVNYLDKTGKEYTQDFIGYTARVVQHEMDHLDGKPFGNRVSRLQLQMAIKKSGKNYLIKDLL